MALRTFVAFSSSDPLVSDTITLSHCLKDNVTERSSLPHLECYPQTRMRHPLQKRVRAERRQAVQRLIGEVRDLPPYIASDPSRPAAGNILSEAAGNRIT